MFPVLADLVELKIRRDGNVRPCKYQDAAADQDLGVSY